MSTAENRLDLFHKTASVSVNTRRGSYMWSYYKQKHATHARVIFWGGGWFTWNIVSDVYILMKGKKSINAERKFRINLLQTAEWVQNADWESKDFFFVGCVITCHLSTHRASRNRFSAISFHNYLHYCGIFLAHFLMKIDRNIISSLHIVFSLRARVGWCDACTDFTNVIKVDENVYVNEMSLLNI